MSTFAKRCFELATYLNPDSVPIEHRPVKNAPQVPQAPQAPQDPQAAKNLEEEIKHLKYVATCKDDQIAMLKTENEDLRKRLLHEEDNGSGSRGAKKPRK
jgi:hypothetical protein